MNLDLNSAYQFANDEYDKASKIVESSECNNAQAIQHAQVIQHLAALLMCIIEALIERGES